MNDVSELNGDVTPDADVFVAESSSDAPSGALFDGDTGTLSHNQRLAVAAVKKFPYVSPLSDRGAKYWPLVREHQAVVRSRLNDEFMDLFFSEELEVAYKMPASTSEDLETVSLLTQRRFSPEQTVLLVALRREQRQQLVGGADRTQVVVNVDDLMHAVEDLRPLTTADRAAAEKRT
ncbi:MAG: DUF4194 domain-containing protein, partial [Fuerstiella sp.]|nr:DUF4194 domain-containing protein [Fuerstiella sp.]